MTHYDDNDIMMPTMTVKVMIIMITRISIMTIMINNNGNSDNSASNIDNNHTIYICTHAYTICTYKTYTIYTYPIYTYTIIYKYRYVDPVSMPLLGFMGFDGPAGCVR